MIGSVYKSVFITRFEAIRDFVSMTIFYLGIIFFRELSSWARGKEIEEILTSTSYKLLLSYASFLYLVFLISWGHAVYKSWEHHREKQRQLQKIME